MVSTGGVLVIRVGVSVVIVLLVIITEVGVVVVLGCVLGNVVIFIVIVKRTLSIYKKEIIMFSIGEKKKTRLKAAFFKYLLVATYSGAALSWQLEILYGCDLH